MSKQKPGKERKGQTSTTNRHDDRNSAYPAAGSLKNGAIPARAQATQTTAVDRHGPSHEQIAVRAYQLWESHGRPAGTDRDDWLQAELLLRAEGS